MTRRTRPASRSTKLPLRIPLILQWADAHHARTGSWPTLYSGEIPDAWGETWSAVSQALDHGARGLPGGSSLAKLLAEYRGVRNRKALPRLTARQILAWATAHRQCMGRWPTEDSGPVADASGEAWKNIDAALRQGLRGQPGGDSLARLLERRLGVRNSSHLSRLTERQILAWADRHHDRTGKWPTCRSGPISGSHGERWSAVHAALETGRRGLPGGDSLFRLLARHRGVRRTRHRPPLTEEQILAWADAHHVRTGKWPTLNSGRIVGTRDETWKNVSQALKQGHRALQGGLSLGEFLERRRDYRRPSNRPRLTLAQILRWADAHRQHAGKWPGHTSGRVVGTTDETWFAIEAALVGGFRGLPGGSSLARLLQDRRGYRNPANRPRLTIKEVLAWADAHHHRTGSWPTHDSGPIKGLPGETWQIVDNALVKGLRGLKGGSSIARLLAQRRGHRNPRDLPRLTISQILQWADAHHRRTGKWPGQASGLVVGAPGERWRNIQNSLVRGGRGLPAGLTIAIVLAEHRGVRHIKRPPPLTVKQVLTWAQAHHRLHGEWPTRTCGEVVDAPGETWRSIDAALCRGHRGLPGGLSLSRFLSERRR